jgi:hypothetical protein
VSPTLNAHGVSVTPPGGFEGRVFRRPAFGEVAASAADGPPAPAAETPGVVVHVATIALPPDIGDFASGAVDQLQVDDVLVVLFEYDAANVTQALFARNGVPRALTADVFSPTVMQRTIPGQAGCQFFFNEGGRAFCLYAVIGAYAQRAALVEKVNAVLATVQIEPTAATAPTGRAPTTPTAPSPSATTTPANSTPATTSGPPSTTSGPPTTTTTP